MGETRGRKSGSKFRTVFILILLVLLGLLVWDSVKTLPDRSDAAYRVSSDRVSVSEINGDLYFLPAEAKAGEPGLAIYPGARVPPAAYSYLARAVAESGRPAVILKMPLGFAIFDSKALERARRELPGVERWVLAGHSLGGVAAAAYAARNPAVAGGLVFLASYPSGGSNLSDSTMPVLSIRATNDHLTTAEKVAKAKPLLPPDTVYAVIEGGNHAQFGEYGPQSGDGAAEITTSRQKALIVDAVLILFASFSGST